MGVGDRDGASEHRPSGTVVGVNRLLTTVGNVPVVRNEERQAQGEGRSTRIVMPSCEMVPPVDDVKTSESRRSLHITGELLSTLKLWKQSTQFPAKEDWIFASPFQIGRLPWSYDQVWRVYLKAGAQAGIGALGTHVLRHTFRSWLDSVGTSLAVQQKLMRHADIRTTMNVYGDIVTDEMSVASDKVAGLALNGAQTERKPS